MIGELASYVPSVISLNPVLWLKATVFGSSVLLGMLSGERSGRQTLARVWLSVKLLFMRSFTSFGSEGPITVGGMSSANWC